MSAGLFLLGALGALLIVYLAKEEVIPEFRPLFDTFEKKNEANGHREHIKKTEKDIDDIQARLRDSAVPADAAQRLTTVLQSSQLELEHERSRLSTLEREIKQDQIVSRTLGFVTYIVLGGVFGALLAGKVEIEGWSGDLPSYFQSLAIGATWTSYLSVLGFRLNRNKAGERIESRLSDYAEKLDETVKKRISQMSTGEALQPAGAGAEANPPCADDLTKMVTEKLDFARIELQHDLDMTRQMVVKDVKGLI